jgi:hypothetical protein
MSECKTLLRSLPVKYFEWLVVQCGLKDMNYDFLLLRFYKREFSWTIPLDHNRASDGLLLREEFESTIDLSSIPDYVSLDAFCGPANLLEVFVGLVRRLKLNIESEPDERVISLALLHNLGLGSYLDFDFPNTDYDNQIEKIFIDLIERRYNRWGHGGSFFPMPKTFGEDMREKEIWYQMHSWIQYGQHDFKGGK